MLIIARNTDQIHLITIHHAPYLLLWETSRILESMNPNICYKKREQVVEQYSPRQEL